MDHSKRIPVVEIDRIPPTGGIFVELTRIDREVAVFRSKDGFVVVQNTCPHMGGNLAAGMLDSGGGVHCPLHDFVFDAATGRCFTNAMTIQAYRTETDGGWLYIWE